MRIFICCSKHIYDRIPPIKEALENLGHQITLPNSYDNPGREEEMRAMSAEEHRAWKADMIRLQEKKVRANDGILVLNMEKHGMPNYIGGATFLEMFKAFELGRPIYLWNEIPESILRDEIQGFGPKVIGGDVSLII